ncbi:MAG: hypothetical protein JW768_02110 [Chitinispirillaceae bacterium]|nr:hypothetical protein [Chitinispirillaceae bacterium]
MIQHKELAAGKWNTLSFCEQMANIGSEVERTILWKTKGNPAYSISAFERALELLDLTIRDRKNRKRLKEITRIREALADHFYFDNEYRTDDTGWRNYFFSFNYAARAHR